MKCRVRKKVKIQETCRLRRLKHFLLVENMSKTEFIQEYS